MNTEALKDLDSVVLAERDYLSAMLREGEDLATPIMASLLLGMLLQQQLPRWCEEVRQGLAEAASELEVIERPRLVALGIVDTLERYLKMAGRYQETEP